MLNCVGEDYMSALCLELEKALKVRQNTCGILLVLLTIYICDLIICSGSNSQHKGNASSKRQHVHGCSLVRARKFYGYHSSEELFLKIYLYPYILLYFFLIGS